jgi:hypothetical protein
LEHSGYAKRIAHEWWRKRHNIEAPKTTHDALQFVSQLKVPKKIHVWCNKKHPEIVKVEF